MLHSLPPGLTGRQQRDAAPHTYRAAFHSRFRAELETMMCIEPRLRALQASIVEHNDKAKGRGYHCANSAWFLPGRFESQLIRLVGWHAQQPELRTSRAFDLAFHTLYGMTAPCRGCRCP